ncbi:hypothetical protein FOMG_17491 [Fusarium oxysporum f. sp. melonis 26406]|uniref:Uncharacterized protein n=1 Tax=Fusarium oxysporum f. sp. melonis 26406 TaxID=1089452 RepID=W9ZXS3_FUSOX|nr:hypothetical protein FOMG_17491 [Fusarium oxysporum f. sp. melonis 26406]
MSKEHLSQLTGLANAGIAPKEIRTFMRQNTDTIATQQDIYNQKDFGVNFKPVQTVESKLFYLRIQIQWHIYRHIRMS